MVQKFDGDTLKYNALMDYVAYKELDGFVGNDVAMNVHALSSSVLGDIESFSQAQLDELQIAKIDTLKEALSHFGCQTIISLCTTLEVSMREYLRVLFLVKPQAMFDFLGLENSRGHIPLKEVLQVSSHADLLARLAHTASGTASKGKYGQVYIRALSCSGSGGDKDLVEKLNSLQVERNKFVHERHRPNVGMDEVLKAHLVVDETIQALCKAGVDAGVPGRYTCVSPVQVIAKSFVVDVLKDV